MSYSLKVAQNFYDLHTISFARLLMYATFLEHFFLLDFYAAWGT